MCSFQNEILLLNFKNKVIGSGPRIYRHEQMRIIDKEAKNTKHAKSGHLAIFTLIQLIFTLIQLIILKLLPSSAHFGEYPQVRKSSEN